MFFKTHLAADLDSVCLFGPVLTHKHDLPVRQLVHCQRGIESALHCLFKEILQLIVAAGYATVWSVLLGSKYLEAKCEETGRNVLWKLQPGDCL